MDISTTRRANVLALCKDRSKFPFDSAFATRIGVTPSYLSRMLNGGKGLGERLCRDIEQKLGLAHGVLDLPQAERPKLEGADKHLAAAIALQKLPVTVREHIADLILALAQQHAVAPAPPATDDFAPVAGAPRGSY